MRQRVAIAACGLVASRGARMTPLVPDKIVHATRVGPLVHERGDQLAPAAEPTLLEAPAPAAPLAPGAWRLRWQVLALDGHITRGDIPFTLRAP